MEEKYYTGVGSRKTPDQICSFIASLARHLKSLEYVLRSGGADGADLAFEAGLDWQSVRKEIYLPWKGFNNNRSNLYDIPEEAYEIAEQFHPRWSGLSPASRSLMARNTCQVLGHTLDKPSRFLVCWTPAGACVGGTAQAMRIASYYKIPIFNLGKEDDYSLVAECVHKKKDLINENGKRFREIRENANIKQV